MAQQNMEKRNETELNKLPVCAAEFIKLVIKKMRYRKKVRQDVQAELTAHFEDELRDCATDEEREQKAKQLIEDFGDAKLLGALLRRAKKRCRPLWRTVVARAFQTIGVLILCLIIYVTWFLTGKPVVSVDYLTLLNQMSKPQVQGEDNAWPRYEKAIALFVEPDKSLKEIPAFKNYRGVVHQQFDKLTEAEQLEIRKWVEQNTAAWQEFVAASSKSYCYREYQYDPNAKGELWSIRLPHLSAWQNLTRVGFWRAQIQTDSNQPKQAIEDFLVIARASSHWQGKVNLVEQYFGIFVSSLAHQEMLDIVGTIELSPAELKQLQQQLLQIYPQGYPLMQVEAGRVSFMDRVQHAFTEGGPGGGHLVPRKLQEIESYISGGREQKINVFYCTVASFAHARRDETVAKANEIYDRMNSRAKMSPYERHISDSCSEDAMISTLPKYKFRLLEMLVPAVDRASEMAYRGRAWYQATVTILVLKQWRLEKNEYPARLDELVTAGYLKEIPDDPYSDKPLIYKKVDGDFVLYSVGFDFEDDGGQVYRDDKGRAKLWTDEGEGDAVFWPVQK